MKNQVNSNIHISIEHKLVLIRFYYSYFILDLINEWKIKILLSSCFFRHHM